MLNYFVKSIIKALYKRVIVDEILSKFSIVKKIKIKTVSFSFSVQTRVDRLGARMKSSSKIAILKGKMPIYPQRLVKS